MSQLLALRLKNGQRLSPELVRLKRSPRQTGLALSDGEITLPPKNLERIRPRKKAPSPRPSLPIHSPSAHE